MSEPDDSAQRVARAIHLGGTRTVDHPGPFLVAVDGGESFLHTLESHQQFARQLQAALDKVATPPTIVGLLDVSHVAGSSQTQALFRSFISALPSSRDAEKAKLLGYLQAIPWTSAFAEALHKRIRVIAGDKEWVLVVPTAPNLSESRSRELVEAVLYLAQATAARSVVFCECMPDLRSHRYCRVPGAVRGLPEFLAAVRSRIAQLSSQKVESKSGILTRLFAYLSPTGLSCLPVDEERWVAFITQCCYPDLRHVDEILVQLALAIEKVEQWSEEQSAKRRVLPSGSHNGDTVEQEPRSRQASILFDAERVELFSRAWFIAILYAVRPEEINRARQSLSGAFSLYGSQVRALAGHRQLVALGGLTARQADENLASLFQRAMSAVAMLKGRFSMAEGALVGRFPSASALRRHIDWQFGAVTLEEAGLPAWEKWIDDKLRRRIEALAAGNDLDELDVTDLRVDDTGFPEALLERAAWILELIELERPSRISQDKAARERAMSKELRKLLDQAGRLVTAALALSDATMRFEALIIRSRYLALCGSEDDARECVSTARQIFAGSGPHPIPQSLLADLAEAYVDEVVGSVEKAPMSYVETAKAAHKANVDEVMWRAVYGAMRCDLTQIQRLPKEGPPEFAQLALRAQVLLQVQTSRSPRLVDLADRSKSTLFVSYRRESREIASRLVADISRKVSNEAGIRAWFDQRIEHQVEDFAPSIQKKLSECRAALFIVSRQFWESCYCCCEMWFMASRSGMSALKVPVLWVVVDDQASPDTDVPSEDAFKALLAEAVGGPRTRSTDALLHFLDDVARDRVLGLGTSIFQYALKARRPTPGADTLAWIDVEPRVDSIEETLKEKMRELALK